MLFLAAEERRRTRKIAWVREFSVFSNRKACPRWSEAPAEPDVSAQYSVFSNRKAPPLGASPFEYRSQQLWQCSLQLRTGFRVDPFFVTRPRAEDCV
jgi:hypothetical protein